MKVMFVSTRYHPYEVGGAEVTVRLLAEGSARAGHAAVVVTLAPDGRAREAMLNGVRVHYLPLFNVYFPHEAPRRSGLLRLLWHAIDAWNPVMAYRLGRVADRERPDLVHVHTLLGFTCAIWPALRRRGIPILQTLHDHYAACMNSLMYRAGANCVQRCARCRILCWPRVRLSRHVDGLTSVSARLLQRIGPSGLFPGRHLTRVIHNCNADPAVTVPRPGPRRDAPLRIGFLGRLEPIKGLHILLEAAQRIGERHVRVRIGGSGMATYERELKERYATPLAVFLGRVAPSTFFRDLDVLVVPSLVEEASGRVVHEAFGFGVPVVGVSQGGMAELISEGRTGFVVTPGSVSELEALLRRLLADPPDWRAMSAACLQEAERFVFRRVFEEYSTVWQDMVRAARAGHGSDRTMQIPPMRDPRSVPL
jgi:glycosyltransferase involved in cell wall biosynthesis